MRKYKVVLKESALDDLNKYYSYNATQDRDYKNKLSRSDITLMEKYKRKFQEVNPAMGALYYSKANRDRKDFFGANVLTGSFGSIVAETFQDLIDEFSDIDLQLTVVGDKTNKLQDTINIFVGNKLVSSFKIAQSSNTSAMKIEKEIRKRIAKYRG